MSEHSTPPKQDDTALHRTREFAPSKAASAIADFLGAAGFSLEDPHLQDTPVRVATCWQKDLLDGYDTSPAALLSERYPAENSGMVMLRDIQLHGVCPHHLLPFVGRAHLAYLPGEYIVGFSKLGELVRCLAHRLTLQETVTQALAQALLTHLDARAAGCVVEAQHMCMILRAPEHHQSHVVTSSFVGEKSEQHVLQQALLGNLPTPPHP